MRVGIIVPQGWTGEYDGWDASRAWASLRDRGMAVDFRWDTGSAPKYLEAYQRAIAIRRGG